MATGLLCLSEMVKFPVIQEAAMANALVRLYKKLNCWMTASKKKKKYNGFL